jgi:hypothetical protein
VRSDSLMSPMQSRELNVWVSWFAFYDEVIVREVEFVVEKAYPLVHCYQHERSASFVFATGGAVRFLYLLKAFFRCH